MESLTASSIISFAEKIEDDSASFYAALAKSFEEQEGLFLGFAKESKKNKVAIVRTYQETITDALEACFAFEGLDLRDYVIDTTLAESIGLADALTVALTLEDTTCMFYLDAAERSQGLLATIPRVFTRVARKRSKRREQLKALLG